MISLPRRLTPAAVAVAVAMSILLSPAPASAVDPTSTPSTTGADPVPVSPPTVHAEMAASLDGTTIDLAAGAVPQPLAGVSPGGGVGTSTDATASEASVTALPNGLSREVFGYLPWWEVAGSRLGSLDYDLLSTIAYFGLPARADGTLARSGDGWTAWSSANMTSVINAAHAEGVKVVLTVTMMAWDYDYTDMAAVLNDSTRRTRLANDIASVVAARNADGVNLDFEPMPNSLQAAYTAFVRAVRTALGPDSYLTVATTGGAASWDEGYDLPGLVATGAADAIMVMGYDFNWSGSAYAGGVAPIDSSHTLDVRSAMDDYLARVPGSKLVWGVPYYGRAWTTTTTSQNSRTCVSAGTCTARSWAFRYTDALTTLQTFARRWDAAGRVPWYLYHSSTYGTYVQGYYEDAVSLGIKYDMVEGHRMRGVGIWHLLMDAGRYELWNEIERNFKDLPFSDIEDSTFWQDIVWLWEQGISDGCGDGRFCPVAPVTRGEMAAFLSRALVLAPTDRDFFVDDDGITFELSINRAAAAAVTYGCADARYCPTANVTRGQMASFLARALALPASPVDYFTDDDGTAHENDINRLAAAGIASGCATDRFCPATAVTREQMAAFLRRSLGS